MGPFTYKVKDKIVKLGFHEVPPEVLEDAPELVIWAQRALKVATEAKVVTTAAKKTTRKSR